MGIRGLVVLCFLTVASVSTLRMPLVDADVRAAERYWPQWRGPLMTGLAPHATPPVKWSETKNVRWKVEIPGKGSATPVVWGDRIYVMTSVPTGEPVTLDAPPEPPAGGRRRMGVPANQVQQFTLLALGRTEGKVLWKRVLREELPHEETHPTGTWASAATDGEVVIASFGSRGLYALDTSGDLLWEKDLGDMTVKLGFGEGSSPALGKERVFVQWDHEGESFLVALDRKTGRELWRQARDEKTSWASPLVVEHVGVLVSLLTRRQGRRRTQETSFTDRPSSAAECAPFVPLLRPLGPLHPQTGRRKSLIPLRRPLHPRHPRGLRGFDSHPLPPTAHALGRSASSIG